MSRIQIEPIIERYKVIYEKDGQTVEEEFTAQQLQEQYGIDPLKMNYSRVSKSVHVSVGGKGFTSVEDIDDEDLKGLISTIADAGIKLGTKVFGDINKAEEGLSKLKEDLEKKMSKDKK